MSSRTLTSGVTTEIAKSAVEPVIFVSMDFTSTLYLWSGIGDKTWDGHTWQGTGYLGKISAIQETLDVTAKGISLELSGVPSSLISITLDEDYQGRDVIIWLGFMDNESIISDPVKIFSGRMDVMQINEQGETSTIIVSAESRLADLLKAREWRYTDEDQQILHPGDKGLEFVNALQTKEIVWGPH